MFQRHGIDSAPERSRKTTWEEFLMQHWDLIVAADFFTIKAWTTPCLRRFVVLLCAGHTQQLGGASPLANLMEGKA